jgi:hypothetical protein
MDELDLDFDASLDASLDLIFPISNAESPPTESSEDVGASGLVADEGSGAQNQRRYYPKRPHRKSRAGCKQCKRRKVKVCLSSAFTPLQLFLVGNNFIKPLIV